MSIIRANKVLVIGDIMLDIMALGNVDRFAPNLHIPVLCFKEEKRFLGGAGNVFHNIHAMNIDCDLCGCVANDENGKYIIRKVGELSKTSYIYKYNQTTTTKRRYMEYSGEEFIRVDNEQMTDMSEEQYRLIENEIHRNIKQYKIVVFSDYNKGFLKKEFVRNVIKICKKNNVKTVVDTKRRDLSLYKGCDILKVNKNDLIKTGVLEPVPSDKESQYIINMVKSLEVKSFLMTAGDKNITFIDSSLTSYSFAPTKVTAKDTTGAGDIFISALISKTCKEEDVFQAIDYAKNMCALAIQKLGTSVVEEEMKITKLVDKASIGKYLKIHKENGKSIVFVNGCFDILHAGHINLLKQAKGRGDILIVGLNSDKSIEKLKGKHRPIINETQRYVMLSAIEYVDHIIIFDEDTPCELIDMIKPNVIYKGAEYKEKDIPERNQVLLYEGELDYCKNTYDISTTDIINRIVTRVVEVNSVIH